VVQDESETAMKWIRMMVMAALGLVAGVTTAWAGGGHHHGHGGRTSIGVVIGPAWGPWYAPPRYYYPPYHYSYPYAYTYPAPVIIENRAPPVYIEQPVAPAVSTAQADAAPTQYWYYCAAGKGYYPYVKECPSGWQKVLPTPPGE
jgi:hypothetical protein